MGIFDMFKKKKEPQTKWTVRTGMTEEEIRDAASFEVNMELALSDLEAEEIEFIVLSPSEPINNVAFLQVCTDGENGALHIEAGLDEKNAAGRTKILCRDNVPSGEVLDIFSGFFRQKTVDTNGWYEL